MSNSPERIAELVEAAVEHYIRTTKQAKQPLSEKEIKEFEKETFAFYSTAKLNIPDPLKVVQDYRNASKS